MYCGFKLLGADKSAILRKSLMMRKYIPLNICDEAIAAVVALESLFVILGFLIEISPHQMWIKR